MHLSQKYTSLQSQLGDSIAEVRSRKDESRQVKVGQVLRIKAISNVFIDLLFEKPYIPIPYQHLMFTKSMFNAMLGIFISLRIKGISNGNRLL